MSGLFVATGGSGHAFKFFPVLGDKIVDAIGNCLDPELREMWMWKKQTEEGIWTTTDESRGGRKGMILHEEINKSPQAAL